MMSQVNEQVQTVQPKLQPLDLRLRLRKLKKRTRFAASKRVQKKMSLKPNKKSKVQKH